MQEHDSPSEHEQSLRTAAAILQEVGHTPESLAGRSVFFFGPDRDIVAEGVPSAHMYGFEEDIYFHTDELLPEGTELDIVIGVRDIDFTGDLADDNYRELLGVLLPSVKDDGEIIIANPTVDWPDEKVEDNYFTALAAAGIDASVTFTPQSHTHPSRITIRPIR